MLFMIGATNAVIEDPLIAVPPAPGKTEGFSR